MTLDELCTTAQCADIIIGRPLTLCTGDAMAQRGADHARANHRSQPARLAFVLSDAAPLGIGHPVTGPANAAARVTVS